MNKLLGLILAALLLALAACGGGGGSSKGGVWDSSKWEGANWQ